MTFLDLDDDTGDAPLQDTTRAASAFASELARVRDALGATARDAGAVERGLSTGLRRAIDGLVVDGDRLSTALQGVGRSLVDSVYKAAVKPLNASLSATLGQGLGGAVASLLPFAKGGTFAQGRVMPFAKGGVVSQATPFAMRGATGLMGEAGPEAIMPLTRGPDGRLGVQSQGGAAPNVTIHVTTPDAQGFRRSQGQIAAEMSRLLGRGARNR
ncbi:phage tail tape measure protein [Rubellimicrobium aerolatum]|uniref:Phage tail tape measure protein n=1 Tax=Rubellimicrobium aerolatum TaxID=490979 RepID=A0ABW0SBC2_9RHOB|nr:phage tail tape measure protein [Rubellimicrobium aerolatum]MBP1805506.1 phage-related minor tail protein [Rubellimicrobium aerolatum]